MKDKKINSFNLGGVHVISRCFDASNYLYDELENDEVVEKITLFVDLHPEIRHTGKPYTKKQICKYVKKHILPAHIKLFSEAIDSDMTDKGKEMFWWG